MRARGRVWSGPCAPRWLVGSISPLRPLSLCTDLTLTWGLWGFAAPLWGLTEGVNVLNLKTDQCKDTKRRMMCLVEIFPVNIHDKIWSSKVILGRVNISKVWENNGMACSRLQRILRLWKMSCHIILLHNRLKALCFCAGSMNSEIMYRIIFSSTTVHEVHENTRMCVCVPLCLMAHYQNTAVHVFLFSSFQGNYKMVPVSTAQRSDSPVKSKPIKCAGLTQCLQFLKITA